MHLAWSALIVGGSLLVPLEEAQSKTLGSASDPEDVDGRLDLIYERAVLDRMMTLHIRTAEQWRNAYLASPEDNKQRTAYLFWEFNTDRDEGFDCSGGFFRGASGGIRFQRSGPQERKVFTATRPTRRSVKVRVPSSFCGFSAGDSLRAQSAVNGRSGSTVVVEQVDVAPTMKP
jgi:hypothetical protein